MCNFDDMDFDNPDEELMENELLTNSAKAQEFILNMVVRTKGNKMLANLTRLQLQIINTMKKIINYVDIDNEIEMFYNIEKIFKKIYELNVNKELRGKKVIGIAGGFSSGKSTFINSLITSNLLPEDIDPSSAIPTYILYGREDVNITVQNFFMKNFHINREELLVISHQFQKKYDITFSRILENIRVAVSSFPYGNLCFLDTPGYTKSEVNAKSDNTDIETARTHLLAVDYMIWVCNVEGGTIQKNDLDFIKSLHLEQDKKILVVLNKADKKPSEDLMAIRRQVENELSKNHINTFGVALYSSSYEGNGNQMGKEFHGNIISDFLTELNYSPSQSKPLNQLRRLKRNLENKRSHMNNELKKEQKIIRESLKQNKKSNIENSKSLLKIYGHNQQVQYRLNLVQKLINTDLNILINKVEKII